MTGPNRARLDSGMHGARSPRVNEGGEDWLKGYTALNTVADALDKAAEQGKGLGGHTGKNMFKAMSTSASQLRKRANLMLEGSTALYDTGATVEKAIADWQDIDKDLPPHQKKTYSPPADVDDMNQAEKDQHKQDFENAESQAMLDQEAKREKRAQEIADKYEKDMQHPIKVMQKIYGYEPPPPPPITPDQNVAGAPPSPSGVPQGPTGLPKFPDDDTTVTPIVRDPQVDPTDNDPGGDDPTIDTDDNTPTIDPTGEDPVIDYPTGEDPDYPGLPDDSGSDSGDSGDDSGNGGLNPGKLGVGIGLGVGAGTGLAALGRSGGLSNLINGQPLGTRGVAPIGSTARNAVSGALGRGAATAGSPTSAARTGGTGARSGVGGAGGRGGAGGAGGRGSRGGRGAGAGGAGGRGRGKKDRKGGSDQDFFDDGDDWLDDEGGAPGVLE